MGKTLFVILILIFLFTYISASCESGQIDINSASTEELEKITQIGPSRAQQIISLRPFNSVDDLARVSGIGNGTRLNQIKTEGLACVEDEKSEKIDIVEETSSEEDNIIKEETLKENSDLTNNEKSSITKSSSQESPKEVKTIILTPLTTKDIKSKSDKERLNKDKLAIYGLIVFCLLLAFLFIIKKEKNRKNEFR
jgi:competence ComEA-like helix-hairpin-helix protein